MRNQAFLESNRKMRNTLRRLPSHRDLKPLTYLFGGTPFYTFKPSTITDKNAKSLTSMNGFRTRFLLNLYDLNLRSEDIDLVN
jgi:hypothetical protein